MAKYPHLQQHFGQGLGNGGDGPPNERQHDNPQRGHYAESLRPIVVRDHQKSADGIALVNTKSLAIMSAIKTAATALSTAVYLRHTVLQAVSLTLGRPTTVLRVRDTRT